MCVYTSNAFCATSWGWLNSNETIRNETTEWALSLNQAYKNIVANYSWSNFVTMYSDYPIGELIAQWVAQGGEPWDLIEPSDGCVPLCCCVVLWGVFFPFLCHG